ncbi:MAG: phosphoribosylglycinamide formyltransferase [Pseudomonadota bacterium]
MRLAVLASHAGTTLQAVIDSCAAGELAAEVSLVISNNSQSGALARAAKHSIPARHISSKTDADPDKAMLDALAVAQVDYVLLLGYMKKLGPATTAAYSRRILNTHPALLPKFGGQGYFGRRVHEAVIAAGETVSGATVHWVDAEYDTGPVLAQQEVAVQPDDDAEALEARVKALEKPLLIETLKQLAVARC